MTKNRAAIFCKILRAFQLGESSVRKVYSLWEISFKFSSRDFQISGRCLFNRYFTRICSALRENLQIIFPQRDRFVNCIDYFYRDITKLQYLKNCFNNARPKLSRTATRDICRGMHRRDAPRTVAARRSQPSRSPRPNC